MPGPYTNYTQDMLFSMERLPVSPFFVILLDHKETENLPFVVDDRIVTRLNTMNLSALHSSGRLSFADESFQALYPKEPNTYAAACSAYFYIHPLSGNFLPLAIRTNVASDLVYTPADSHEDWMLAKLMFNNNDLFAAQVFRDDVTHAVAEIVNLAALRTRLMSILSDDFWTVYQVLQAWVAEEYGPAKVIDFPAHPLTDKKTLINILVQVVYITGVMHDALNSGTLSASWTLPMHPAELYQPIPTRNGVTDLMPYLPDTNKSPSQVALFLSFNRLNLINNGGDLKGTFGVLDLLANAGDDSVADAYKIMVDNNMTGDLTSNNDNMAIDFVSDSECDLSDAPSVDQPQKNVREANLDAEILALAGGDTTEEEDLSEGKGSPQANARFEGEHGVIIRTDHNLRHRSATGEIMQTGHDLRRREMTQAFPYLASWQREQQQKRCQRTEGRLSMVEDNGETSGDSASPPPQASRFLSPEKKEKFSKLIQAAIWVEQNDIPCTSPNCPVGHPHGEGLYRYEGEVPNSDLANVYFAPSIPPPAVVEAFNKINGRPSWQDLVIKDRFFDYHTVPCRPSKHLDKVGKLQCKSKNCGVESQPHQKGLYLDLGFDASLVTMRNTNHIFGISNPPPKVWDAAVRMKNGNGTERDHELVHDFSAHHTRWEDGDRIQWEGGLIPAREFKKWQKEWKSQRP
ncbi:MAG: hypothetical protein Q9166_002213 [cf. Caloplaca sp. 2 TL-2023]